MDVTSYFLGISVEVVSGIVVFVLTAFRPSLLSWIWTQLRRAYGWVVRINLPIRELALSLLVMAAVFVVRTEIEARSIKEMIIMTDVKCGALKGDWKPYDEMGGRFPISAGKTTDGRGQERTLKLGEAFGRYQHDLLPTEAEGSPHNNMPPFRVVNFCRLPPN